MMKYNFFIFVLFALLIAACRPAVSTSTPTFTPDDTATPAATLAPTLTPTRPPPTATVVKILSTPTSSPLDIAGNVLTDLSIDENHAYSPNGYCEWKRLLAWPITEVAQMKYSTQYFTYVTVNCANQDKPWVLEEKWTEAGLGYPLSSLLGWSADSKYAYIYDEIIPDGCQPPGGFQADLRQVELATGGIHPIPISWTGGIALSPETTRVIYYDHETVEVGIYDTIEHQQQRIPFELPTGLEYWYAGDFTWSPDGQSAIFIIQYGDPCFPSGYSLRRVYFQLDEITTLLEVENQFLSIIGWSQPDKVLVSIDNVQQVLDPVTGKLSTP